MTTTDASTGRRSVRGRAPARAIMIAKVELKFAHLSNRDHPARNAIEIEDGLRRHATQALGAPWPDRPAREVEVPPRGEPMPADVDPALGHVRRLRSPAGGLPRVAAALL